jgi:membrane protease YdiL (CAAX protease family)
VQSIKNALIRHPLVAFFLLAYAISWLIELPVILAHLQNGAGLGDGTLLLFLGSFGPSLAAVILTAASEGSAGVRALLGRLLPWRVSLVWILIALYGFLALGLPAITLLGAASVSEVLAQLPLALVAVPVNALTSFLVLGPLGEELGWRGYALPRLQAAYGALAGSGVLGLLWAYWHAPLMLFPEWRGDLPVGAFLIVYPLYTIPLTIIFAWVFNGSGGSVFVTTALHAAFNYTVFFLNRRFDLGRYDALPLLAVMSCLFWLVALGLSAVYGPRLGAERIHSARSK